MPSAGAPTAVDAPEIEVAIAQLSRAGYRPIRLTMQTQMFYAGALLGGVNRRIKRAYILGSISDMKLRLKLESLDFKRKRQYEGTSRARDWYEIPVSQASNMLAGFQSAREAVDRRTALK